MLDLRGFACGYGLVQAVESLDLTVEAGCISALLGPNGAGKTSTLMAIAGHVEVQAGAIRFLGEDITHLPPAERTRRGIAIAPEGRRIFPDLTVAENLLVGGYTQPIADARRSEQSVFDLFPRLAERRAQRAGSLSGGEQQMLAIGRAMMAGPCLLLLDEPSLGLAPRLAAEILDTLGQLNRDGIGVLLVEQRAPLALKLARRAYLLAVGRVVAEVTPDQIASPHDLARYYFAAA